MPHFTFAPFSEFERARRIADENQRFSLLSSMCRLNALSAIKKAGSGHIGSSFSGLDIFVYFYFFHTTRPEAIREREASRDIFFSSKGHDCPGQYAAMTGSGLLPFDKLLQLRRLGGLEGHPEISIPGMEANTGSLGMGISKAKGMVLAKRLQQVSGRVYVMTGDGEFQEGQIWESLQSCAHQNIDDLSVIMDCNRIQTDKKTEEIMSLGNLQQKLQAFGWDVLESDGHDFYSIRQAFSKLGTKSKRPQIWIAQTVKGKGVSFMETLPENGELYAWHAGAPADEAYDRAVKELLETIDKNCQKAGIPAMEFLRIEKPVSTPPLPVERLVQAYGQELESLGETHAGLVVLDADLAADCGLRGFEKRFPERFFECGIAEQDMVSTAGGLALQGFLPVVNSFGCFLGSRANEQIYNNATERTRIIYTAHYAGILPAGAGRSHQSVRDISLFGVLPNCTVLEPANAFQTRQVLRWCVQEAKETCMLRLILIPSPGVVPVPESTALIWGCGQVLEEGSDVALFASGPILLHEALAARSELERDGLSVKIINMPWLNRVDDGWFQSVLAGCSSIFVLDNHLVRGGLGDTLADAFLKLRPSGQTFHKIGLTDYPVCGTPEEVLDFHLLSRSRIAAQIRQVLSFRAG